MIRGTCDKARLLDLVENFTLFMELQGGLIKLLGKNHQYLGVNNAIEALRGIEKRAGRLGVFWHTQGSGKSVSMICFAQKVLRKIPGNWTFVIITDRQELDHQIYKYFAASGAVTEQEAQATSSHHLRQLLTENHRYVFTLIHKFRTERGEEHPVLSERSDIIVITDEGASQPVRYLGAEHAYCLAQCLFYRLHRHATDHWRGEDRVKSSATM